MPSRASSDEELQPIAIERILATLIVVCMATALLGFIASLIQKGMVESWPWLAEGVWPYTFLLPAFALPIGFVCIIVLLGISMFRKSRNR